MPPLYKSWDPPRRVPRQVDDILRLRTPSSSEARRTREPSSKAVALGNQSVPDSGRIFLPCLNYQREIRLSVDLPMPRCRKCRLGCSRPDTQVGISRLLTKKTQLGVRGCIPKSAFLAPSERGRRWRTNAAASSAPPSVEKCASCRGGCRRPCRGRARLSHWAGRGGSGTSRQSR